jgi:chromosome segregation ATPase
MEEVRKMVSEKEENGVSKVKKFRISLIGYGKKEVEDYISTTENSYKAEVDAYERKLADQSAALSMALREREKLAAEYEEMREKLKILSADTDEKQSELAAENYILKARIADLSDIESKNSMLISQINDLSLRCEHSESEQKVMQNTLGEKEETILEQCRKYSEIEKNLKLEIEKIKAESERDIIKIRNLRK